MRVAPIAALVALTACACNLLFPLDDYGPPADATVPSSAAADSSSDSPNATPFCRVDEHAFCADFDEEAPFDAWDVDRAGPGELTLSTTQWASAPASVVASTPRRSSEQARFTLAKTFPGSFRRMVVECDLYLDPVEWASDGSDINVALVSFNFESKGSEKSAYLFIAKDLSEFGSVSVGYSGRRGALPSAKWIHARFDVDPGSRIVAVVGAEHYEVNIAPVPSGDEPRTVVVLGVNGFNVPAPAVRVHYDNVTVDFP